MLDTICEVLKASYSRGWITTRDGNASLRRRSQPWLYITPTGARKQNLTSEQILKLRFPENQEGLAKPWEHMSRVDDEYQRKIVGLNPSGELPFHFLLQNELNTSNRVVLHLHCTYTVAALRSGIDLAKLMEQFPEINGLTRIGQNVPFVEARSENLGRAVYDAFGPKGDGSFSADIVGIDGHGVVAIDIDPWKAFEHCERLEHICHIVLASGVW
jgi:L-fuculose-phosphate aldolase